MQKYTNEDLIKILKDKAKELGRTPTKREVKQEDTIRRRFGSFNNGLEKAGLVLNKKFQTDFELLKALRDWVDKHGRVPFFHELYKDKTMPDPTMFNKRFGTYADALIKAGLKPHLKMPKRLKKTQQELLELFKKEYYRIKPISNAEFNKKRGNKVPTVKTFCEHLNSSWYELLLKIGVPKEDMRNLYFTNEELLDMVRKKSEELGHAPSTNEMGPMAELIRKKFGNWNTAIETAGCKIVNETPVVVTETNEELLKQYIEFSHSIGKDEYGATSIDLQEAEEVHGSDVYMIRFSSMHDLRKAAGFKTTASKQRYSKEEITKKLRKTGRLSINEINKHPNLPAAKTIMAYFKTTKITKIWEELGL